MQQQDKPSAPGKPAPRPVRPALVLHLRDIQGIPYTNDAEVANAFLKDEKGTLKALSASLSQISFFQAESRNRLVPRRFFTGPLDALRRYSAKAQENAKTYGMRGYRPLEFDHYFLISLTENLVTSSSEANAALRKIDLPRGGRVYLSLPTKNTASNDYVGDPAQGGIGATQLQGLDGKNQVIVHIDKGWLPRPNAHTIPQPGELPPEYKGRATESTEERDVSHGVQVTGIISGGQVQGQGAVGIAPQAAYYKRACLDTDPALGSIDVSNVANAIYDAGMFLGATPGVILVEQANFDDLPIETSPDLDPYTDRIALTAMQEAALNGHIVIEPAGNANTGLPNGSYYHGSTNGAGNSPFGSLVDDGSSMAVMVAAGRSGKVAGETFGTRHHESNFGERIDCWAWGDSIATLEATTASGSYVPFVSAAGCGHTSGAAAIVAGAVLLMMQIRANANKAPLKAWQVRELLRNQTLNTVGVVDPNLNDKFGERCMPNLANLAQAIVGMPEIT